MKKFRFRIKASPEFDGWILYENGKITNTRIFSVGDLFYFHPNEDTTEMNDGGWSIDSETLETAKQRAVEFYVSQKYPETII